MALERNQTAERSDIADMLARLEDPEVVARLCAEESFLRKFVFRGLNDLKPAWDSLVIAHFDASDFIRVVDRCSVLGVRIIGIEIFTTKVRCWTSRYRRQTRTRGVSRSFKSIRNALTSPSALPMKYRTASSTCRPSH